MPPWYVCVGGFREKLLIRDYLRGALACLLLLMLRGEGGRWEGASWMEKRVKGSRTYGACLVAFAAGPGSEEKTSQAEQGLNKPKQSQKRR